MSVSQSLPTYETWSVQACPFCGSEQPMVVTGITFIGEESFDVPDRGYSFCNCKNIWFTNWSNIDQGTYVDPTYAKKHDSKYYTDLVKQLFRGYAELLIKESNGGKKFLDLGSVNQYLLDEARASGFDTYGLDITNREDFGHQLIVCDMDSGEIYEKFDVIMANHFFEHIHHPLEVLAKCYKALNEGGLLFVSMPDPFQVNWNVPKMWRNWAIRQHYIMWDMDSFCEEANKIGFKTLLKKRNLDVRPLQDMHLLFRK